MKDFTSVFLCKIGDFANFAANKIWDFADERI